MEPFRSTFTIDVRRLRVLRELHQRGTVGATAKALALTPSAISQQLSSLSREVGVPLLEPQGRGVRLTTQARILRLLTRLKTEYGMSMLFVTHDLGVLAQICDRVAVMYAGELAEIAPTDVLYRSPRHPYTLGLIAAVPRVSTPDDRRVRLRGLLQRSKLGSGCRFAPRCDYAQPECMGNHQNLRDVDETHQVACWLWEKATRDGGLL